MAQSLSINIDSPIANEEVGQVVPVSGTLNVIGTGLPRVSKVDKVEVRFGTNGPVVQAQVVGPSNPGSFPRSFSCSGPLPSGLTGGQSVPVTVTVFGMMEG